MSEFSSSFHIRTRDADLTKRQLLAAKMSGLVFGPANSWLTFVPEVNSKGFDAPGGFVGAIALANATNSFVLHYSYAEDHMWSFAAIRPGNPPSLFIHSWYPPRVVRDQLDLSVFGDIVDGSMIEPYLAEGPNAPDGTPRAYGFAEALGLPAFRWLSPRLVDVDLEHFLKHGGQRIGRKRRKPPSIRSVLPPPTKLTLPKSGVSAREAFTLLQPLLTPWFQPPWVLNQVSGSGLQGWEFKAFNAKTGEAIMAYLLENGNAGCRSLGRQAPLGSASALPEAWLDSPAILRIAQ